jgi:ATP-dependent Clp protease protease subunit
MYDEVQWFFEKHQNSSEDLYFIIDSGGGSVVTGLKIIDLMNSQNFRINCVAHGDCASMAAIILMNGYKSYSMPHSRIMTHQLSGGTWGKQEDIVAYADMTEDLKNQLNSIVMKNTKKTDKEVREMMVTDSWFTAVRALKENLIDEILITKNTGENDSMEHNKVTSFFRGLFNKSNASDSEIMQDVQELKRTSDEMAIENKSLKAEKEAIQVELDGLKASIKSDKEKAELETAKQQKETEKKEVSEMLEVAVVTDKKLSAFQKDEYLKDYESGVQTKASIESSLKNMGKNSAVNETNFSETNSETEKPLDEQSYSELMMSENGIRYFNELAVDNQEKHQSLIDDYVKSGK